MGNPKQGASIKENWNAITEGGIGAQQKNLNICEEQIREEASISLCPSESTIQSIKKPLQYSQGIN